EGVEEVEEDGVAGRRAHRSGFRWAKPSSDPCQNRTAVSPYFQQRLTGSSPAPGASPAKATRPVSTSFTTPPSASISPSTARTSMVSPSTRSARAFHSRRSDALALGTHRLREVLSHAVPLDGLAHQLGEPRDQRVHLGGREEADVHAAPPGLSTNTTCTSLGPCTPRVSVSSMSAVRDGPVMKLMAPPDPARTGSACPR